MEYKKLNKEEKIAFERALDDKKRYCVTVMAKLLELTDDRIDMLNSIKMRALNANTRNVWGKCRLVKDPGDTAWHTLDIGINQYYAPFIDCENLLNVIIHELLHSLFPSCNHDGAWLAAAELMNLHGYAIHNADSEATVRAFAVLHTPENHKN